LAGAVTGTPLARSLVITPSQLDASANAPWTSTTVGHDPSEDQLVDVHVLDGGLQRVDIARVHVWLECSERMSMTLRQHDLDLLVL